MPFLPGEIISTHYGKVFDELTMHKSTKISILLLQRDFISLLQCFRFDFQAPSTLIRINLKTEFSPRSQVSNLRETRDRCPLGFRQHCSSYCLFLYILFYRSFLKVVSSCSYGQITKLTYCNCIFQAGL